MPAAQVRLHLLLLQARLPTEQAARMELIGVAGAAGEGARRHHSLCCGRGEKVDHPMLVGKMHLEGVQVLQKLR